MREQCLRDGVICALSVAGGVPQVFLTAPSGTVQIPVSAVQLHQVGAEWYSQVLRGYPCFAPACTSFVGLGRRRSLGVGKLSVPPTCG